MDGDVIKRGMTREEVMVVSFREVTFFLAGNPFLNRSYFFSRIQRSAPSRFIAIF